MALIRNHSNVLLDTCNFTPVTQVLPVYHAHVLDFQYFFFVNATSVTLICSGVSTNLIAHGFYSAPDHCEVRSSALNTLPSRHHMALFTNVSNIFQPFTSSLNVSLSDLKVVSEKLRLLSYFNTSDVDLFPTSFVSKPHVVYSLVSTPILVSIVMVVVLFFCYRRFRRRLPALPLPVVSGPIAESNASEAPNTEEIPQPVAAPRG